MVSLLSQNHTVGGAPCAAEAFCLMIAL